MSRAGGVFLLAGLVLVGELLSKQEPAARSETAHPALGSLSQEDQEAPPPAYELAALPAGLDTATSLEDVARLQDCWGSCDGIVYAWSPRMPLSRAGIAEVALAAERLGATLTVVSHEELQRYAEGLAGVEARSSIADGLLEGGALAHAPALVAYGGGGVRGPAILGFKTAGAYEAAVGRRLAGDVPAGMPPWPMDTAGAEIGRFARAPLDPGSGIRVAPRRAEDFEAIGVPGAYFRFVPGRGAVAYESGRRIYLLDLESGRSRVAPGYIDFVPTPDGRYFVTPGEVAGGLAFYDADEVFEAVRSGRPGTVEPIFTDLRMRDQYPSVGILSQAAPRTRYRILTSWFEEVVYRDYDVEVDPGSGVASVRPVGEPVRPCAGISLSTPIMSQDGSEVAGRDEATGTTKIFGMLEGGTCEAVTDFGIATSKVAWHRTGRRLAFAIPRRGRGTPEGEQGIFVFDRDTRELKRLPSSGPASRLAFPDWVGDESVVFLVPGATLQDRSIFRIEQLGPEVP